jgi:hypothetical protein
MLGWAAISRCRRALYSALRLVMVETALAISASDLPRTQPAMTRNRGNAYRIVGERDRAIADYRKALSLKLDDANRRQI